MRSISQAAARHDQVTACLFAAGIATHILLVAGLRNPTVRARYVATRALLAGYGHLEFHDRLLELPGSARISRERASHHLAALTRIFDAATTAIKTPFSFESDLTASARPMAIDASLELIESGYHREAMFWIAVMHSRCQKVPMAAPAGARAPAPHLTLIKRLFKLQPESDRFAVCRSIQLFCPLR
jgi:hypothetical protein